MNIAVIKHNPIFTLPQKYQISVPEPKKYLFSVPEGVKLKAGDTVMCKTGYGEAFGWLVYDSFEVEGPALEAILGAYGAGKLQPIIGVYELCLFDGAKAGESDGEQ